MKSCIKNIIIIITLFMLNKILYADEIIMTTTNSQDLPITVYIATTTTNVIAKELINTTEQMIVNTTESITIELDNITVASSDTLHYVYLIHLNQLLNSIILLILIIIIIYLAMIYFCNYKMCSCEGNTLRKILFCCRKSLPSSGSTNQISQSIRSTNINLFSFYFKYLFSYSIIILMFLIIRSTIYLFNDSNTILSMFTNQSSNSTLNASFIINLSIWDFNYFTLKYLHFITNLPFLSLLCFLNVQFLIQILNKNFFKIVKSTGQYSYYYLKPSNNSNLNTKRRRVKRICCKILTRLCLFNNSIVLAILLVYIAPMVGILLLNYYLKLDIQLLSYNFDQILVCVIIGSTILLLLSQSITSFITIIRIFIKIKKFNMADPFENPTKTIESNKLILKKPKFNDLGKVNNSGKYYPAICNDELDNLYSYEYGNNYYNIEDDKKLIQLNKSFFIILKESLIFLLISICFTLIYLLCDLSKLIIKYFFINHIDYIEELVKTLRLSAISNNTDFIKLSIEYLVYLFHILFIIVFLIGLVKFFHEHMDDSTNDSSSVINKIGKKNMKKNTDSSINFTENSHLIRKLSNSGVDTDGSNKNNNYLKINDFINNSETLNVRSNSLDSNDAMFNQTGMYSYSGQAKLGDQSMERKNFEKRNSTHYELPVMNNDVSTFKNNKNSNLNSKISENAKKKQEINTNDDPAYKVSVLFTDEEVKTS